MALKGASPVVVERRSDGVSQRDSLDIDALLAPHLDEALAALDGRAPLLAGMVRYHFGEVDAEFHPSAVSVDRGKRIRPALAMLSCGAVGGDPRTAAPLAAAIELLHNFTLIHDDVQDESPTRRHRPTVWSLWGVGQAINAGDALFAAARIPLYRLARESAAPALSLELLEAFDRVAIRIVEGQTRDLEFEGRPDVTPDAYLAMIADKTAAILQFATWAGALLGGAAETDADRFSEFGLALGVGFQIHDDKLGIWGAPDATGKAADDLRRRKQTLPVLLLRQRADAATRAELDRLYAAPEIDEHGVARILALLDAAGICAEIELRVAGYHERARAALEVTPAGENPARDHLLRLLDRLADRHH